MQQVENLSLCFLFSNSTITEILPKTAVAMKKENKKKGGGGGNVQNDQPFWVGQVNEKHK